MKHNGRSHLTRTGLALLVGMAGTLSAPAFANQGEVPVKRLIVKFKDLPDSVAPKARTAMAGAVLQVSGARAGTKLQALRETAMGAQVVALSEDHTLQDAYRVAGQLLSDPAVAYAEPDLLMLPSATPNDPRYNEQWHYYQPVGGINAPAAWDQVDGDGVVVAVLDTGYRPHADLVDNLLPGYDFVSDSFMGNDGDGRDSDARDPGDAVQAGGCGFDFPPADMPSSWHGTHVAGTIAATGNNGVGVTGVAPGAKVVPLRVLGKCGGYTSDITDAMLWAAGISVPGVPDNPHPAHVLNLSLGSPIPASCTSTYADTIAAVRDAGTLVVIAAGNEAGNASTYPPGNCTGAFTVAATNRDGGRAYYSNYGTVVDVAAPGGAQYSANDPNGILSLYNSGSNTPGADSYSFQQGTSMAAPHVAGVAALVYAAGVDAVEEVETVLKQTVRAFPGSCSGCGAGIVDAGTAVAVAMGTVNPTDLTDLALKLEGDNGKFKEIEGSEPFGTIQYIARVTNNGPLDVAGAFVEHHLPERVTLVSLTPSQGSCNQDNVCDLGALAVGEEATMVVNVMTDYEYKMDFSAQVRSEYLDAEAEDNFALRRFGGAFGLLWVLVPLLGRRIRRRT